ncbi:hypothetical protein F5051DRAFT_432252 [Lentinula edodes]|nr:hypothetical protein F5051DRAFT_432252 [Lentinula edodes]
MVSRGLVSKCSISTISTSAPHKYCIGYVMSSRDVIKFYVFKVSHSLPYSLFLSPSSFSQYHQPVAGTYVACFEDPYQPTMKKLYTRRRRRLISLPDGRGWLYAYLDGGVEWKIGMSKDLVRRRRDWEKRCPRRNRKWFPPVPVANRRRAESLAHILLELQLSSAHREVHLHWPLEARMDKNHQTSTAEGGSHLKFLNKGKRTLGVQNEWFSDIGSFFELIRFLKNILTEKVALNHNATGDD